MCYLLNALKMGIQTSAMKSLVEHCDDLAMQNVFQSKQVPMQVTGIILFMRPTNERRRNIVSHWFRA